MFSNCTAVALSLTLVQISFGSFFISLKCEKIFPVRILWRIKLQSRVSVREKGLISVESTIKSLSFLFHFATLFRADETLFLARCEWNLIFPSEIFALTILWFVKKGAKIFRIKIILRFVVWGGMQSGINYRAVVERVPSKFVWCLFAFNLHIFGDGKSYHEII
jgi:hypothetical protein